METAYLPEYYAEDISLSQIRPAHFLAAVQKAAVRLHWITVSLNDDTIICHTPGSGSSGGGIIKITVKGRKATLYSRLVNEYDDETAIRKNAELFKEAIAHVIDEHHKADRNLHPMHREKYGALVPSRSYLATPLLVYSNVLVFIAMVLAGLSPLHPLAQSLLRWGGNYRPAVLAGEWWRLLTYMFVHGGAMHLFMNMFALLYIGMFLEPLMGKFRFASAYLLTGVCAGLMSITFHPSGVGVGASGAIFGMYGVFLSMLTTSHLQKTLRKTLLRSILFFIVFNLMTGLQGNTDNAAHIGGLLSGIITGYAYYPGIAKHSLAGKQLATTLILAAAVLLLVCFVLPYL